MRRWIPFLFLLVLVVGAGVAAIGSAWTSQQGVAADQLAEKLLAPAQLPGWNEVGGRGVLVESQVPPALRCGVPPASLFGPIAVAVEFRSRDHSETIQEIVGQTPAKGAAEVRRLVLAPHTHCNVLIRYIIEMLAKSPYAQPPFSFDFGWVGQPRSIQAPPIASADIAWSGGKSFGTTRIFSYEILNRGVLLGVTAYGGASAGFVQEIVREMAAKA